MNEFSSLASYECMTCGKSAVFMETGDEWKYPTVCRKCGNGSFKLVYNREFDLNGRIRNNRKH